MKTQQISTIIVSVSFTCIACKKVFTNKQPLRGCDVNDRDCYRYHYSSLTVETNLAVIFHIRVQFYPYLNYPISTIICALKY